MDKYIEKVAAGLRAMEVEPNAFVYFPEQDSPSQTYDKTEVLGRPVYRCGGFYTHYGYQDHDVPFVPVWMTQKYDNWKLLPRFRDAYKDA